MVSHEGLWNLRLKWDFVELTKNMYGNQRLQLEQLMNKATCFIHIDLNICCLFSIYSNQSQEIHFFGKIVNIGKHG